MKAFGWWRQVPHDDAGIAESKRRLREADALARRLAAHRAENRFGEKFHAALRLEGHHQ